MNFNWNHLTGINGNAYTQTGTYTCTAAEKAILGPCTVPIFTIDPSPGVTTLNNIAGGTYQLQILDGADRAINTINVTVIDGQQVQVDV